MKKILLVVLMTSVLPQAAQAGFSLKDGTGQVVAEKPTTAPTGRIQKKPALEIVNERYVPEVIRQKYKMGDDYFEMTKPDNASIVVQPQGKPQAQSVEQQPIAEPVEIAHIPPAAPLIKTIPATPKALVVEAPPQAAAPVIPVPEERQDTWRARKGEKLKEVLKRWSDRAGTEFVWTAAESPMIKSEFSYVGTFQEATTRLMDKNAGQLKMKFADDVPPPVNVAMPAQQSTPMLPEPVKAQDWSAGKGAPLETVLRAWAEKEGASLVWDTEESFAVRAPVSEQGNFEDAVMDVLTQFDAQKSRPIGQLFKNPVSGEKVLVIRSDKAA